jgi:2-hydroxy-3-oxopropionate reductase
VKIGFIGLGIMGKPMARNLLKAGHELVVFDLSKENMDILVNAGALAAESSSAVASKCSLIITMLPNGADVKAVVCGENGILCSAKPGTILIDMSSIAPFDSQALALTCEEKGVRMIDAPVSGGEPKAIEGTLSIMCGGKKELFDECIPLLSTMGSNVVYCGQMGAGNTTKLANQIIVALNIAAVAEAFMLVKRSGLDPAVVFEAIKSGLAGSAVLNAKGPMMLKNNTKPGFKIDLHIKDLANAIDTGHVVGSPLPLAVQVMEMMQVLHIDNMGQFDHSAIAKYYEKLTGETIY